MTARARFIRSVIDSAKKETTRMPWTRGITREVTVAARRAPMTPRLAVVKTGRN